VGRNEPNPLWKAVVALAVAQHGVISLPQLVELGLSASGARNWVQRGRLHRVHRGVYSVGTPLLGANGKRMAAVLACGPHAVLSHRAAAGLWALRPDNRERIDVTVPCQTGRKRKGIQTHQCIFHPADVTTEDGIPVTTVARTLLDLADVLPQRGVERAVDQAERLRLFDLRAVDDVLSHANGRRGAARLVAAIAAEPAFTRSYLEELFLAICRSAGVPHPESNYQTLGVEIDFCWPERQLAAEVDSWTDHHTRRALTRDASKARVLTLAGWRVVRFTYDEVAYRPAGVAADLRALLA
jgi:hypothetical protein